MAKLHIKPKTITLRPRHDRDEAFLRLAYESSRDDEFKDVSWPTPEAKAAFFAHQFDTQQKHFDVMYSDLDYDIIEFRNEPIGRLVLSWEPDHLHCVDIIIITEQRRNHIGTAIMNAIVKEVDRQAISTSLMFEKWKPYLQAFYEKYGFVVTKEYPAHWKMERAKPDHPKTAS